MIDVDSNLTHYNTWYFHFPYSFIKVDIVLDCCTLSSYFALGKSFLCKSSLGHLLKLIQQIKIWIRVDNVHQSENKAIFHYFSLGQNFFLSCILSAYLEKGLF